MSARPQTAKLCNSFQKLTTQTLAAAAAAVGRDAMEGGDEIQFSAEP